MKLHKDGTLEGTAKEMAEYQVEYERLGGQSPKPNWPTYPTTQEWWKSPSIGVPNPLQPVITCGETKSVVDIQLETQKSMNPADRPVKRL